MARLAASPEVRSAFNWFRTQEPQLLHWQMEMARIPAPPFGESARAEPGCPSAFAKSGSMTFASMM